MNHANIPARFLRIIIFAFAISPMILVGCAGSPLRMGIDSVTSGVKGAIDSVSGKQSVIIYEPISETRTDLPSARVICESEAQQAMTPSIQAQSIAESNRSAAAAARAQAEAARQQAEAARQQAEYAACQAQQANNPRHACYTPIYSGGGAGGALGSALAGWAARARENAAMEQLWQASFNACMVKNGWRNGGVLEFTDVNTPDSEDPDGWTPLFFAVAYDNRETANWLISLGANVNAKDVVGWTPLDVAALEGHFKTAQILIRNSANVNVESSKSGFPLQSATIKGSHNVAELLIKSGADVNAVDINGFTALHTAARYNAFRVADLLLSKGANTEVQGGDDGFTPLHRAAFYGSAGVADLLIGRGANKDAKSYSGETPLDVAKRLQKRDVIDVLESESSGQRFVRVGCFNIIGSDPDQIVQVNGVAMTLKVDTGADITHLTNQQASEAGIQKAGKSTFTLADGSSVVNDVGYAYISLGRELTAKFPVSIGDGNGLLGRNVLDQFACQ